MEPLIPAYLSILASALLPIVAGAHSSLTMPKEKRKELKGSAYVEREEDEDEIERVTTSDAYWFPVIGGGVLCSLYFAFKYLGPLCINRVLSAYFVLVGLGALAKAGVALVRRVMSEERWDGQATWKWSLTRNDKEKFFLSFSALEVSIFTLSLALTAFHHVHPTWPVANLVALSLAFGAIALLRLDSFFTGAALLTGLFLYDIWFVFGTAAVFGGESVMVSVAKSVEGPIAVRFPKNLADSKSGMTMLGLGDIVLPGSMLALALRFDYHLALERMSPPPTPRGRWPKPYFYSTLVAYVAGLVTTIVVMHTFMAAQPALLYLSPACVAAPFLCALVKGELKAFWAFDDGAEEERLKQEAKEKKEKEEQGSFVERVEGKVGGGEELVTAAEAPKGVTSSLAPESVGRVLRSRTSRQNLQQ